MASNRKIIIGVVVPSLAVSGGVQTIVEMLIRQIELSNNHDYLLISLATSVSDDCSTRILKPSTLFRGPYCKEMEWRGRKLVHVGCSLTEFEFMRYRQRALLRKVLSSCDIVQVVCGFPAWGISVLDCGRPVSIWAATRSVWERRRMLSAHEGIKTFWRRLMTRIINRLDDVAIRAANSVMIMNPLMRDYVTQIKLDAQESLVYAPPGVDTLWFTPVSERLPVNQLNDDAYILSVGRFGDPRKNPELLLEAFVLLKKKIPSLPRLVFAGSASPSKDFWRKVTDYGLEERVTFCDKPDDLQLKRLYQGALCFGLSSDEEGFGMVIVEAMACGVPVIATRCGGPEAIITDGVDGFLVDIGDARAFSEQFFLLCSDQNLNRRMGGQARMKVETHFSEQLTRTVFFNTWAKLLKQ